MSAQPARATWRRGGAIRRGTRGLSLFEIVIAMALLTVNLAAISQMQIVSSYTHTISRNVTRATQIAQEVGEVLKVLPFSHEALAASSTTSGTEAVPIRAFSEEAELDVEMGFALGDYEGATERNAYALSSALPAPDPEGHYRVYWAVVAEDRNRDSVPESKTITVLVRWPEGRRWKSVEMVQARFNLRALYPLF